MCLVDNKKRKKNRKSVKKDKITVDKHFFSVYYKGVLNDTT
nr:MAG TPA: hypothetical protein [Caudoviricetes sp.]